MSGLEAIGIALAATAITFGSSFGNYLQVEAIENLPRELAALENGLIFLSRLLPRLRNNRELAQQLLSPDSLCSILSIDLRVIELRRVVPLDEQRPMTVIPKLLQMRSEIINLRRLTWLVWAHLAAHISALSLSEGQPANDAFSSRWAGLLTDENPFTTRVPVLLSPSSSSDTNDQLLRSYRAYHASSIEFTRFVSCIATVITPLERNLLGPRDINSMARQFDSPELQSALIGSGVEDLWQITRDADDQFGPVRPMRAGDKDCFVPMCYILIGLSVTGIGASLALALWWSIAHEDVSGGFTVGAYVVAAFGLLLAIPGYRHSQICKCWTKYKRLSVCDGVELRDLSDTRG